MSGITVLSWSITGPRGLGRTDLAHQVAKKFESLLPETDQDWTFKFLGNPFGEISIPPLGCKPCRNNYARVRLLQHWQTLYRYIVEIYEPMIEELERGTREQGAQISLLTGYDGFGKEGLADALYYTDCDVVRGKVFNMHLKLVQELFVNEGISPPLYYSLRASIERVEFWMLQKYPELENFSREDRLRFIKHQLEVERVYFQHGTGQKHFPLDAERFSLTQLADQVVAHTLERIEEKRSIAA